MQITTFNPMIITANVDEIIKTFEAWDSNVDMRKQTLMREPAAVSA